MDQDLSGLQIEFEDEGCQAEKTPYAKRVARKVLQHIVQGGATTVETLSYLAYFMRRIPLTEPSTFLKSEKH